MDDLFRLALEAVGSSHRAAFVTLVETHGSAPQVPGAKMLVILEGDAHRIAGTIGGGKLEYVATAEAVDAIRDGRPRLVHKDLLRDLGMACGGRASYFIEPFGPRDSAIIFGGGHVGLALARVLDVLRFSITVIDSRTEFANEKRFPMATRLVTSHDPEVLDTSVSTDRHTYVVIVSRDHPTDFAACRYFLPREWAYLGVIASKSKYARLRRDLVAEGFEEDRVARISSPVGLPIGGSSPEEIAVSIAAEIVQEKNRVGGSG